MLPDSGIVQIQLHQVEIAFPALVPEAVVVVGIAVKVYVKPVLIRRIPFLFPHIPEGGKSTAHMVEDPVEKDLYPFVMEGLAERLQVFVVSQTHIQPLIVPGVIAVGVGFEEGREVHGVYVELL